jgi:hypothetical protein
MAAEAPSATFTTELLAERITDGDPVRHWRFEQLARAGYPTSDALVLSGRGQVDVHAAVELLRRGCQPSLAVAILL